MTTNPPNYFIRLDNREKELIKNTAKLGFPVKTEQLVVGDIQFWNGNNILICIERKTYADLSASIKTGRYREQKHRLLKSYPKKIITYLLEGRRPLENEKINGISGNIILSAILNLQFRDELKILFSLDISDTVAILNKLFQKLSTFTGENSETNYADTREISKKSQLTPRICYQIQLSQIPGISTKIAECIIEQYPSLPDLFQAFIMGPDSLAQLKIKTNKKNGEVGSIKLGIKKSRSLFLFLHGKIEF